MPVVSSGPLVGVLGGMGPAATADFYEKLIRATPAVIDQDHLRVVIWADPTVPDRTAALLDGGADPTPFIERGARALSQAGVDLIVIPCNTAHAFLPGLEERFGVRIVHMIEQAVRRVDAMRPVVDRVALLATEGTVRAGLYQDWLGRVGKSAVLPDDADQAVVTACIKDVKSGDTGDDVTRRITAVVRRLVARGATAVVAGCTEIPLVLRDGDVAVPVIDPAQILAEAVVAEVAALRRPV